jgi:hypothetical protein
MIKEVSYQEKFKNISSWMPLMVAEIKKDIKNDHLKNDKAFWKEHFGGKPLSQIGEEQLSSVYLSQVLGGNESIGEFVANRWVLKHSDLYEYFETFLRGVNPNFDQIESLDDETSDRLINGAVVQFGYSSTYLFSVLNSVVLSSEKLTALATQAKNEADTVADETATFEEVRSLDAMEKKHEREIKRLEDRHGKKMAGLEKKYLKDTEMLKKQIANLQRKLG